MGLFDRLFPRNSDTAAVRPLYDWIVAEARAPHWYVEGAVPDTVDGRFDMVATILSLVLIRLEGEREANEPSVWLTERFVGDMDGQLREIGIGDIVVGKHIGRMMSALGGRLGAYRTALSEDQLLDEAIVRNIHRGEPRSPDELAHVRHALRALADRLEARPTPEVLAGRLS